MYYCNIENVNLVNEKCMNVFGFNLHVSMKIKFDIFLKSQTPKVFVVVSITKSGLQRKEFYDCMH